MKIIHIILVALFLMATPLPALAGEIALGVSEQANRNQAISQAGKQAQAQILLQKAAQVLPPQQLIANWERLNQEVFAKPEQYIANPRTLAVSQQGGQTWVLVDAEINQTAFDKLLAGMRGGAPQVKLEDILCLVCEDVAPGRPALYWWSAQPGLAICPARIARGLKQLGYQPFNSSLLMNHLTPDITSNVVLTEAQVLSLAEQAGTGLVLWGRVRAYPILSQDASESTPLLQLALLSVEGKRVLAQVEVEGAVFRDTLPVGFEGSMDKEAAEALAKLFELAQVKISAPPAQKVIVELQGITSATDLARLERSLLRLDELVLDMRRESLSPGKATLLVDSSQDGIALAGALEKLDETGWQIKVLERGPGKISVSLDKN